MPKVKFLFVMHNHQPVGNFGWVIEEAYNLAYKPLLDVISRFPNIKFGLHISGPLWEWLESNRPEYFEVLKSMHANGQLEMIGGGFYEPILPILPERDQVGQIEMMKQAIQSKFGVLPKGAWTTERVWEPQMPQSYQKAGVDFTFLDDTHFHTAGIHSNDLHGIYKTAFNDSCMHVFPISKLMRYAVPFKAPNEAVQTILDYQKLSDNAIVCLADDGEKFGLWPHTFQTCYEEKWLEQFFTLLGQHEDQIEVVLPSEVLNNSVPVGSAYLPNCSYFEMTEWALPAKQSYQLTNIRKELATSGKLEELLPYLRGGHWRNFLVKYPEINNIYKRMLYLSEEIDGLPDEHPNKKEALLHLYKSQCNCAYWHGVFGGVYLPHIRGALWENIILGEQLINEVSEIVEVVGSKHYFISSNEFSTLINGQSGVIETIELKKIGLNLVDTLQRREEAYHLQLAEQATSSNNNDSKSIHDVLNVKDSEIIEQLVFDKYSRHCAIEHILPFENDIDSFNRGLTKLQLEPIYSHKLDESGLEFSLRAFHNGQNFQFKKQIVFISHSVMEITYLFDEIPEVLQGVCFGSEWSLNLRDGHSENCWVDFNDVRKENSFLDSCEIVNNVQKMDIHCNWMPLLMNVQFTEMVQVIRTPLQTASLSEGGIEKVYQETMFCFAWVLKPKSMLKLRIRFKQS